MKEQFVSYEIAFILNEKGFDWHCLAVYMNGEFQIPRGFGMAIVTKEHVDVLKGKAILAPLWQQVIDWLDKKELFCSAEMRIEDGLFKWYPVVKTVVDYEEVKVELSPRGTKQNALINIITHALTLI